MLLPRILGAPQLAIGAGQRRLRASGDHQAHHCLYLAGGGVLALAHGGLVPATLELGASTSAVRLRSAAIARMGRTGRAAMPVISSMAAHDGGGRLVMEAIHDNLMRNS